MERSPERLTSLGGLVGGEELARARGVGERVDEGLEGPKSGRGYQPREFVQALLGMLPGGGRRLEALRELRAEHEVLRELGLPSVPEAGVGAMNRLNRALIRGGLEQESEEVTLDVEATEIKAEKEEAQWTDNKVQGYLPLLGYVKGVCVGQEFRPGNVSPGAKILEFARSCEAALPPGKRVYFRSDSAAYQAAVIHPYSQPGRSCRITADWDQAVKREIRNLPETAWTPYRTRDGIATDREIAETGHTRNETKQAFRLIRLRWPNPPPNLFEAERYCYHAVAPNREEPASAGIWKPHERGNSENWPKELKSGFGMEQMPCGQFHANALYFAIGVLAYHLAQLLKRQVLPESYRTGTVATLRWKLYRLAGKLVCHAREGILPIKADAEKWLLRESARLRCATLRA